MRDRLDYAWRLCATGFCFFLFGAGGLVLWGILFPGIAPFLGKGAVRRRRAHLLMHWVFHAYISLMRGLGLLTYEVRGGDRLNRFNRSERSRPPGRIVVANHPSLIDVVFLIALIRNATCIVKPSLMASPVMRLPIRAMDYLYAADPEILLERCAEQLREGCTLIIFPEGTRTPAGHERRFQRGAANIALASGAKITPVSIHCTPPTLAKHHKWYRIPPSRVHYVFQVGEDIDPGPYSDQANRSLASRKLTQHLQQYFSEQEKHGKP